MVPRETGRREFLFGAGAAGTATSAETGRAASGLGTPAVGIPDLSTSHQLRWKTDVDGEETLVYPTTRADGAVFAFVYQTGAQDESNYATYAFDIETGETRWTKRAIRPSQSPASNGLVYGHSQQKVEALDTSDGSVKWHFEGESQLYEFTVADGIAVAVTGREIIGLDADNGTEKWRYSLERDDERDETASRIRRVRGLTVAGDSLYFGSSEGFTALVLADGERRWHVPIEGDVAWPIAVRDDLLVGWSERAVYGIETDGTRRFRTPVENIRVNSVGGTVGERAAYVWGEKLTAVDLQTGRKRWTYEPDDTEMNADDKRGYSPIVSDGRVYTSTGEQNVVALDADSGRERWQFDADAGFGHWGTVAGGYAYVTGKQQVHVFDAETGREEWSLDPEGEQNNFWVAGLGDSVFVGTRSGRLYAIDPPSRLATAPVETATRLATSSPGLGLLGLLGAGLLGVGYRQVKRRTSASSIGSDANLEFGRLELLGRGSVTETHLKRVQTTDGPQLVAKTRLNNDGDSNDETRRAFTEAIQKWAELDPTEIAGILPIQNHGTDPAPWFETPFFAGGSLADSWPLAYRERIEVISAVARTLHAAHREGVTRGRLAPGHIFRDAADERQHGVGNPGVRIGGWFLADALAEVGEDSDLYAPPEIRSNSDESISGDVYRVGALSFHLLTGDVPNSGPDSEANLDNSALPSELNVVLERALAADPEDRYDSALAFDDEFRWAALDR